MDDWAAALVLDRLGGQLDRKDEFIFFFMVRRQLPRNRKTKKKKKNGGGSNEAQRSHYRRSVSIDARKHNHQRLQ